MTIMLVKKNITWVPTMYYRKKKSSKKSTEILQTFIAWQCVSSMCMFEHVAGYLFTYFGHLSACEQVGM